MRLRHTDRACRLDNEDVDDDDLEGKGSNYEDLARVL